jgi:hypothetical protein
MTVCFCAAHVVSQQDVGNKKPYVSLYANMWTLHLNKKLSKKF